MKPQRAKRVISLSRLRERAKIRMRARKSQQGLSLLEMMVVLVIVSLVSTLIIQGFGYTLGLYQRVVQIQQSHNTETLTYHWLRSSLSSLAAPKEDIHTFKGNQLELEGYSFQALQARSGIKTKIGWKLQSQGTMLKLFYSERENSFKVYQWEDVQGGFEYRDANGSWQTHWPVNEGNPKKLPEMIRLKLLGPDGNRDYPVKIATRKTAEIFLDEVLYGRD